MTTMRKSKPAKPAQPARPSEPSRPEQPTTPPRKVALIGKAPSSALLAPYDDPAWEVWILNTLGSNKEVPRWDRQFEIHDLELVKAPAYGTYYQWLADQTRPVYTRDAPPAEFKGGVQYPLGAVLETFGRFRGGRYLTNTVSLMVALALHEHVQGQTVSDIGLWGVDMAQQGLASGGHAGWFTSEYARQRPSVEYWIGIAEGLGITVTIPEQSDILKTACIYGYQHTEAFKKFMARRQELQQRIANAQQREQQAHDEAVYLSGAAEGGQYYEQWLTAQAPTTK
jgi:hypothetical protein